MKKTLMFLALVIVLSSCQNQGDKMVRQYFKEVLNDPESLVIHNTTIYSDDDTMVSMIVDYGATNAYGAMVRKSTIFIYYKDDKQLLWVEGVPHFLKPNY